MKDVDDEIEQYRTRLRAQGELADSDLDELEDHLRELTNELRTTGMSAAEAVTEAARRLGDPRQLAREHARVRSRFGVPLSAGRAASAAVLFMVPHLVWSVSPGISPDFRLCLSWWGLATYSIIAIALATRRTWARAVVLGLVAGLLAQLSVDLVPLDDQFFMFAELGVLAFVIPWRRNELSRAAITLALQAFAVFAAWKMSHPLVMGVDDVLPLAPVCERIALVSAVAACVGTVLRARWSAIASAVSALALFTAMGELLVASAADSIGPAMRLKWQLCMFGGLGSGTVAATIAAVLGWRATRSLAPAVTD